MNSLGIIGRAVLKENGLYESNLMEGRRRDMLNHIARIPLADAYRKVMHPTFRDKAEFLAYRAKTHLPGMARQFKKDAIAHYRRNKDRYATGGKIAAGATGVGLGAYGAHKVSKKLAKRAARRRIAQEAAYAATMNLQEGFGSRVAKGVADATTWGAEKLKKRKVGRKIRDYVYKKTGHRVPLRTRAKEFWDDYGDTVKHYGNKAYNTAGNIIKNHPGKLAGLAGAGLIGGGMAAGGMAAGAGTLGAVALHNRSKRKARELEMQHQRALARARR